jgi:hypothetical protein
MGEAPVFSTLPAEAENSETAQSEGDRGQRRWFRHPDRSRRGIFIYGKALVIGGPVGVEISGDEPTRLFLDFEKVRKWCLVKVDVPVHDHTGRLIVSGQYYDIPGLPGHRIRHGRGTEAREDGTYKNCGFHQDALRKCSGAGKFAGRKRKNPIW